MIDVLKKYAVWFIFGGAVIFSFIAINHDSREEQLAADDMQLVSAPSLEENKPAQDMNQSEKVIVDIKGEVNQPGVYEMDASDRIHHVIDEAGGFTEDADQTQVNLAQRVQDEMVILVPKHGVGAALTIDNELAGDSSGKVRINYATKEEIETLNGIGPSKAEAILKYREENGFFQKPEDLLEVSGIGEKTLENFRDQIVVP